MIERGGEVAVKRQAELLDLSRSSVYYSPRALPQRDLVLMRRIDELHLQLPFYGSRKLADALRREGHEVGRRHVRTLMRRMGIEAQYRRPRTSIPARGAAIYPYLLSGLAIERPNQVWSSDITYLPMAHGFMYLVAILDVASRKVLAFRLSNTLTADFCVEALEEALRKFGVPEIFNTDQGSQFTGEEWIRRLKEANVAISMDGKGRWIGRVDDWRGNHMSRGVAVVRRSRCLNPLHMSRFQSPLVEPDVQISRIRLSRTSLRPSLSPRLPGCREDSRGRASHRGTRWGIGGTRCLASLAAGSTIAVNGVECISGSPGTPG
jgi:putative transposase